ncbi:MAG: phosphoserine transaminase [Gammaproteobacteria bacterium RIFCSPHIGHO2_12_FULL_41_20]|nr:MAG: phosphoserine transaminase [Gammaproteobacteria bacterium RIFCSPHIGHO2_12_FULL_41_20]
MRKVFNFSAGPAMLPEEVLRQAQQEMLDWHGTGMSMMELGHRGAEFKEVAEQTAADLRELMAIPKNYHVLFVAGGASTQFAMVPLNLYGKIKTADYIDTGIWSKKAIAEARRYGDVHIAAAVQTRDGLAFIPPQDMWALREEAAYIHYTPNETIEGLEFHWVPKTATIPLVADMTSTILSRVINVHDYGIIYAGAQKNLGPAGINVVILREDLLADALPCTPTLYQYKIYVEHGSFYNTPPTYCWYMMGLVLAWVKRQGGVSYFATLSQRKAAKLYNYLDNHRGFYITRIHPECRSQMNVVFDLLNEELRSVFLSAAEAAGLTNLKGHRIIGGLRASIYNAMPEAGVDTLIEFMQYFLQRHG